MTTAAITTNGGVRPAQRLTVTVAEAATVMGISVGTAYGLLGRGEFPLPARKVGRRYLIPAIALSDFVGYDVSSFVEAPDQSKVVTIQDFDGSPTKISKDEA